MLCRGLGKLGGICPFQIEHLPRRGALIADLFAARQFALGENRGDVVEFFNFLGIQAENVARWNQLLQREIFGVQYIERIWLGDNALGHVVSCGSDILDLDAGVGKAFFGNVVAFIHGGAEIAQHFGFLRHDIGETGDRTRTCCRTYQPGRAL